MVVGMELQVVVVLVIVVSSSSGHVGSSSKH